MESNEYREIIKLHKEIEGALSMNITISADQAMFITAAELIKKYKGVLKRNKKQPCTTETAAFEVVLRYYFDQEEIADIKETLLHS